MTRQITLTVKGNQIPYGFTKTISPYGTKFTAIFSSNKFISPSMAIKNIEINQEEPAGGWDSLEELDRFSGKLDNLNL